MQKLFRNTRAMVAIAILLSLGGLLIGYVCEDFTWFARFCALVVVHGESSAADIFQDTIVADLRWKAVAARFANGFAV